MGIGLTKDNKEKFFSLYWGQDIIHHSIYSPFLGYFNSVDEEHMYNHGVNWYCLALKPLSSISDEDGIEVLNILMGSKTDRYENWHTTMQKHWLKIIKTDLQDLFGSRQTSNLLPYFKSTWETGDYLRSKGYALPYLGISVEEMIEAGWIKLV